MRNRERNQERDNFIDPFTDPVAYLAGLGIEAELIAVVDSLDEAA
ncbi:MAG TPA: hypothetical protein VFZ15_08075 [Acidimicrobiia bacterium]|nr:hypothetical protein [Acidimicrobiia bacterium]